MPTKNELPRQRYPIDYSRLTPRGVKRTIPQWNVPDPYRNFADDSDESTLRGAIDWHNAPPPPYIP